MKKIKDIGERGLLQLFKELVDIGELPFNDDAVAFQISDSKTLVINIDTFVAKTDAPPNMTPYQMGVKTTTMALSDLAAKGIQPQFTIASGAFPANFSVNDTYEIVRGIRDCSHTGGAKFLGGDTNEADDVIISVVAAGLGQKSKIIKRHGANDGDIIFTTGNFGYTGGGFKIFLKDYKLKAKHLEKFQEAIYNPKARIKEGLFLSTFGKTTACIDSSDGLAWSLTELIKENKELGIRIEQLPVDNTVKSFVKENQLDIKELVLYAGEEFELIFTIAEKDIEELSYRAEKEKIDFQRIGKITKEEPNKIILVEEGKREIINPKGWEHFKD